MLNDWALGGINFMRLERNDFEGLARRVRNVVSANRHRFEVVADLLVTLEKQDGRPYRVLNEHTVTLETPDESAAIDEFLKQVREL